MWQIIPGSNENHLKYIEEARPELLAVRGMILQTSIQITYRWLVNLPMINDSIKPSNAVNYNTSKYIYIYIYSKIYKYDTTKLY